MAEASWGQKRMCLECQAPFYDMRRKPIACPKCGTVHQPVALLKSDGRQARRNRLQPTVVAAAAVEPEKEAEDSPDPEADEPDADADEELEETEEVEETEEAVAGDEPVR